MRSSSSNSNDIRRLIADDLVFAESFVPVSRTVKLTGVVRVDTGLFVGVYRIVVENSQRFMGSGVLTDVLVANQNVFARAIVFDTP